MLKNLKNKYPKLTVIYPYFNTPDEIEKSINSLKLATGETSFEVIVVDNNSYLPLELGKNPNIKVIKNKKNIGYGAALNKGTECANGEYLLFSNTDTVYSRDSIKKMLNTIEKDKKIGAVGPMMVDDGGSKLYTKSRMPLFPISVVIYSGLKNVPLIRKAWDWFHYKTSKKYVEVIGGASMLIRKEVFIKIGSFDPQFFLFFEEADICKRISDNGFRMVYLSEAKVIHSVGKSLENKKVIRDYFETSRFRFVKKYQGAFFAVVSESLIKYFSLTTFSLIAILALSLYLNLNRITTLMMFYGDFARDMFVSKDMVINGSIPLLGIPSSVVWLHQGPLSIYLIGASFLFGGFQPVVPAVFYGLMGSLTAILVYLLGKELFSSRSGLLAALFFVTSPLVIVNLRIPYHTAPIPFFTALFYLYFYRFIKSRKNFDLIASGFFLGLLFQLELSNGVLFLLVLLAFLIYKIRVTFKVFIKFVLFFILGIAPFIIYDLKHGFLQTAGFIAWVLNRVRLFLGLTLSGNSTTENFPSALSFVWSQLVRFVFPVSELLAGVIILSMVVFIIFKFLRRESKDSYIFLVLALFIPICGFLVHAQPGTAYFPVLFPPLALTMGAFFYFLSRKSILLLSLLFLVVFLNVFFTLSNNYFLDTSYQRGESIKGWSYSLGPSLEEQRRTIDAIMRDSNGESFYLSPGGFLTKFQTSLDNYHYLVWNAGLQERKNGIKYVFFADKKEVPGDLKQIYASQSIIVIRDE